MLVNFVARVARWHIFKPKIPIWVNLEGLTMVDVVYFMDIWSILRQFGIVYGHLVYFFPFWYFLPRKIWQPSL
jgi:hypothetical protein